LFAVASWDLESKDGCREADCTQSWPSRGREYFVFCHSNGKILSNS
jgi:hypothetical protein